MICTKCNSIIPDEAKFCPTCGAVCNSASAGSTVSEKKHTCVKCGLELEPNAKFCPVCGTAATAVSLEKQPDSDSLVSSMPKYAPPTDVSSDGFGEPAPMPQYAPPVGGFGEASPMPQYAPNGFGTAGNMGAVSTAAAAVAVPAKKKNGAKIAIIIIAAVVVLLGAAAVFFFTNKAAFLSTFMGKSGYATMVEGNSVKEAAKMIDASAISNGTKAASQFFYTSYLSKTTPIKNSMLGDVLPTSSANGNANFINVMEDSSYSAASVGADFKSIIETYSKLLSETYGTDAVKVTANAKINLTDAAISAIGNSSDVNKVIDAINGTTFTYDLAANDSSMGMYYSTEGKIAVNAKLVMTNDGTLYMAFPFASNKALMFKMDTVSSTNTSGTNAAVLELDEKEISRLIEDIIKIYLEHYEKAVTEMENGSLTVNGEEISGKLITADFNGEAISAMLKDMINHIGEDKYFSTQIIDFINSNGGSVTLNQYQSAFSLMASSISVPDSVRFSIKTVINKNGDVLAKSYTAGPNDDIEFTYKNNEQSFNAQLIVKEDTNKFTVNLSCVKTDDKSGVIELSFQENDDGEFGINISYSGVETVKSFNQDVTVGTYTITLKMPKGFESADDELLTVLDGLQFTISSSASADSQTVDLGVKTSAYGDVSLTVAVNKSSSDEVLSIPTDVIDISGVMNGNIDSDIEKKLNDFSEEVLNALKNVDLLKDYIGEIEPEIPNTHTTPNTPNTPDISAGGFNVSHLNDDFNSMTTEMLDDLTEEYSDRLMDLIMNAPDYADYDSVFNNMLDKAYDQYDAVFNVSMEYYYNDGVIDEAKITEWQNALREFVIVVEACENALNSVDFG